MEVKRQMVSIITLCFTFAVVLIAFLYITLGKRKLSIQFARESAAMDVPVDNDHISILQATKFVQSTSKVFLKTEYQYIVPVSIFVALAFSLVSERWSGLAFLFGAILSSIACINGMSISTKDNGLTAYIAKKTKSIGNSTTQALIGGLLTGIPVQALSVFGTATIFLVIELIGVDTVSSALLLPTQSILAVQLLSAFSFGFSFIALFNRVAGGIFTKMADIACDLLCKNSLGWKEDDPRIPAVMADMTGDNVNDSNANAADLGESFSSTIVSSATTALKVALVAIIPTYIVRKELTAAAMFYPLALATIGLLSCIIAAIIITSKKMSESPSKNLDSLTYIAAGGTLGLNLLAAFLFFGKTAQYYTEFAYGWISPWLASLFGIASGIIIGKVTEYYTDSKHKPTQAVAHAAKNGFPFEVSSGFAYSFESAFWVMLILAVAIYGSAKVCGYYGAAISSLGMLSFIGVTLAIDAFGPISDNAGGFAEICGLPDYIREKITDVLDSVGNVTAAIGKGFAIGSAALASSSLLSSYVSTFSNDMSLNLMNFGVLSGTFAGAALLSMVINKLIKNTNDGAYRMEDKCRDQMEEIAQKGLSIIEMGPYYDDCVKFATKESTGLRMAEIVLFPIVGVTIGLFLFGVEFVAGILFGYLLVGVLMAILMANAGAIWDNAKKYVEGGAIVLKNEDLQRSLRKDAVGCDTIGDIFKDVVAPAMDIIMKSSITYVMCLVPLALQIHPLFG